MAKKVRRYDSVDTVRRLLNNYFYLNKQQVLDELVSYAGRNNMDEVRYDERMSRWGLDCGWVWLATSNPEQEREWKLDNGKYDAKVTRIDYPFNCQSVTLKQVQLRKALKDLMLEGDYYPEVRLD